MSIYRKSSFCANSTCVEVSEQSAPDETISVKGGQVLQLGSMVARVYTGDEVEAFVSGVKYGEFDLNETRSVPGRNDGAEEVELGAGTEEQACAPGDVTYTRIAFGGLRLLLLTDNRPCDPSTSAQGEDPTLSFNPPKWASFTKDVKNGALDSFTA